MRTLLLLLLAMLAGCVESTEPLAENEADSDGDGVSDAEEIAAGSDPQNATSVPIVVNPTFEPEWGPESSPIRPGGPIGWCTYNFLFWAPNGTYYIGTAAHCTDPGEKMPLVGLGEIGTVVYDSDGTADDLVDFSLIQLDEGMNLQANPKVFNHDGPTGFVTADELAVGDTVELHGYGVVLGDNELTRDRFGFLVDWTDDEYNIDMPAVNGDSGSSLLHGPTGKAFGIISRYGFDNTPPSTDRGPLMPFIFRALEKAGWGDVQLATV